MRVTSGYAVVVSILAVLIVGGWAYGRSNVVEGFGAPPPPEDTPWWGPGSVIEFDSVGAFSYASEDDQAATLASFARDLYGPFGSDVEHRRHAARLTEVVQALLAEGREQSERITDVAKVADRIIESEPDAIPPNDLSCLNHACVGRWSLRAVTGRASPSAKRWREYVFGRDGSVSRADEDGLGQVGAWRARGQEVHAVFDAGAYRESSYLQLDGHLLAGHGSSFGQPKLFEYQRAR